MRYYRFMWRKYARKILNIKGHPRQIALGFAVGIFIGFTPTFGFQMALILAINSILQINKLAGLIAVQVSNFVTALPMYLFNYWVGSLIWKNAEDLSAERLTEIMAQQFVWFESFSEWGVHWDAVDIWWDFMVDMGGPLWLGSIIVGLLMGLVCYRPVLWAIDRYRVAQTRRREIRYLRIMARKAREDEVRHAASLSAK